MPDGFLHQMWGLCNDARTQVTERVWLDLNSSDQPSSKARVRELTYRALLAVRLAEELEGAQSGEGAATCARRLCTRKAHWSQD